jgi:triacylglycerol lipase
MSFKFNSQATSFDPTNALRLAEASQLAYKNEQEINDFVAQQWGLASCKFFEVLDTQAFIISNNETIILAFRGTEQANIRDWKTNLTTRKVASRVGKVHEGFAMALNRIWKKVEATVVDLRKNKQTLWVTGHSLGGALATLAVDRFTDNNMEVSGLYTFGQPRVGDKEFAQNFDAKFGAKTFRLVNNEDVVPRVPLGYQGYQHVGQMVYFDSKGQSYRNIHWFLKFMDRALSKVNRFFIKDKIENVDLGNDVQDHDLAKYIDLVRKSSV